MKKLLLGAIMLVFMVSVADAQQRPHYTMYMANPYLLNPAMAGSEDYVDLKLGYRDQWSGWQGNPETYYFSGHAPIGKPHTEYHHYSDNKNWLGVGAKLLNDGTGPIHTLSMLGTVTYNIGITKGFGFGGLAHRDGIRLIAGLDLGVQQWDYDPNRFMDPDAPNVIIDPAVASADVRYKPDANFGLWLYQENLFFLGFSAMQILNSDVGNTYNLDALNNSVGLTSDDLNPREEVYKFNRHYFLTAGYILPIGPLWRVYPSLIFKFVGAAPVSMDINGKIEYMDGMFWGGVSYRHGDAINLTVGAAIDYRYEIAYSYDITTNAIRSYSGGSHEIILGYRIPFKYRMNSPGEHQKRMGRHKRNHW